MTKRFLLGMFVFCCGKIFSQPLASVNNCQIVTGFGTNVVINGGISFTGTSNWKDDGEIFIARNAGIGRENWLDSTTGGVYDVNSTGSVHFTSDSLQYFYGNTQFYNLYVAGDSGLSLLSNAEVRNQLFLNKGLLFTNVNKMYVSNSSNIAIQSSNSFANSWVHGRLERLTNTITPVQYLFPVGKLLGADSLYAPVKFAKFNTTPARYTVEYFTGQPFNRTNIMSPPIDHISDVEYWEINSDIPSGPDEDAFLFLSWRGYSRVSANPLVRDSLLVAQYINAPPFRWDIPGGWVTGNASGADSLFGYIRSNSTIGSYTFAERRFTLGTYSPFNSLPVKLLYFTAVAAGKQANLYWSVQQEQDTRLYEVEKSANGIVFSKMAERIALQGAAAQYNSIDASPLASWNYYRLRITDKVGRIVYSPIARLQFSGQHTMVKLFPNPATTAVNILLAPNHRITLLQLVDAQGKQVLQLRPTGNNMQLPLTGLVAGNYFIWATDIAGNRTVYSFVKGQ